MRNSIYWVEIPVTNFERAKIFYETIFGIEMTEIPMPRGKYAIFPLNMDSPGVGGAIIRGEGYEPSSTGRITYLDRGEDLNKPLSKIESAGGQILSTKTLNGNNGEFGFIAHFIDTEGNKMGLHSNI